MRFWLVSLAALLPAAPGAAQQPQAPACARTEYRQFDFWIGTWEVFNPQGRKAGTNTIDSILAGCALHERWQNGGPGAGGSYNMYDRVTGWHQTWVDNSGQLLLLDGGLEGESMVLSETSMNPRGQKMTTRITWTPFTADGVRQFWEVSTDSGSTWTVAFDGRYVRRK
jgi:hypothetical protein